MSSLSSFNGTYHTDAGSLVTVAGLHGGRASVEFDWFEENACVDCRPDRYPERDGDELYLVWSCDECGGGRSVLRKLARKQNQL